MVSSFSTPKYNFDLVIDQSYFIFRIFVIDSVVGNIAVKVKCTSGITYTVNSFCGVIVILIQMSFRRITRKFLRNNISSSI